MAKVGPEKRLQRIIDAATKVFAEQGYGRTQMAEIAKEAGVAPGSIYLYVKGKEALFDLVLRKPFLFEGEKLIGEIPVPKPESGGLVKRLWKRILSAYDLPKLDEALSKKKARSPREELDEILRELFSTIRRVRDGIALIERSSLDWPQLADFYNKLRHRTSDRLEKYLESRIKQKQFRKIAYPGIAARMMYQIAEWSAMQRMVDEDGVSTWDAHASETAAQIIIDGLCPK